GGVAPRLPSRWKLRPWRCGHGCHSILRSSCTTPGISVCAPARHAKDEAISMCGILGIVAHTPVNQLLYDGLTVLQHRGQDAAGIVTADGSAFHLHKGQGMVRDVFRTRNM